MYTGTCYFYNVFFHIAMWRKASKKLNIRAHLHFFGGLWGEKRLKLPEKNTLYPQHATFKKNGILTLY